MDAGHLETQEYWRGHTQPASPTHWETPLLGAFRDRTSLSTLGQELFSLCASSLLGYDAHLDGTSDILGTPEENTLAHNHSNSPQEECPNVTP